MPANQKYISYDCLYNVENTHIITNTELKKGYIMGRNLLSAAKCVCAHVRACICLHIYTQVSSSVLECVKINFRSGTFNGHFFKLGDLIAYTD